MSELTNQTAKGMVFKHQLLATASACALIGSAFISQALARDDSGSPTVWIELGGQLERVEAQQQDFAPHFTDQFVSDGFLQMGQLQRTPRFGNGFEGKISIDPTDTPWIFSAGVRYGRSNTTKSSHNQTATPPVLHILASIPVLGIYFTGTGNPKARRFADAVARTDESHMVLDFQAGRDVGLGMFGGTSSVNLGLRFAQFTSRSSAKMTANPGGMVPYKYATSFYGFPANLKVPQFAKEMWDTYHASASISRSFRGIGPSFSFDDSIRLAGHPDTMQVGLDFGLNGAILIGRQKAAVHQRIYDDRPVMPHPYNFIPMTSVYHHHYNRVQSHTVAVPNIGGFAGLSFNYSNAKIKLGYRADFFFGAMDGGIDTRKTYDRNFYGPFATISVGLGG